MDVGDIDTVDKFGCCHSVKFIMRFIYHLSGTCLLLMHCALLLCVGFIWVGSYSLCGTLT